MAARAEELYREYVVAHGLERGAPLELLHARLGPRAAVLYPGCFLHVTPSFHFQHVVYVDRTALAAGFFADGGGVDRLIAAHRGYRPRPFVRFLHADFTQPLPLKEGSFDLLLSLYAGGVSKACARYLREGGLLVSNDHHGDAREAAAMAELVLCEVVEERRGRARAVQSGGYAPGASCYLFRKAQSRSS